MHRLIRNNHRLLLHILFWIFVVGAFTFTFGLYNKGAYFKTFQSLLFTLPVDMGWTYFVLYFLIPRFLFRGRYFSFLTVFILTCTLVLIAERAINMYIADRLVDWGSPMKTIPFWHPSMFMLAININIIVFLAASIKLLKQWYFTQKQKNELERQNQASELALLRSQVSPHFLFNTLNNIHTLVSRESEVASDAIVKLSEIMRYMLYEANSDSVPLQKEIDYLRSYIDLQRLRIKDPGICIFRITGDPSARAVAPMLFIPFIENAFKHGEKKSRDKGIEVDLVVEEASIRLKVTNYMPGDLAGMKDHTGGIGLRNVTRRLELLYPGKHDLTIRSDEGRFVAELIIFDQ